jgi:hypothetical protein
MSSGCEARARSEWRASQPPHRCCRTTPTFTRGPSSQTAYRECPRSNEIMCIRNARWPVERVARALLPLLIGCSVTGLANSTCLESLQRHPVGEQQVRIDLEEMTPGVVSSLGTQQLWESVSAVELGCQAPPRLPEQKEFESSAHKGGIPPQSDTRNPISEQAAGPLPVPSRA